MKTVQIKVDIPDWNSISEREYLSAMIKSHTDTSDLSELIESNLINKLYDRLVFFKGLDSSYYYEGMYQFESVEIAKDLHDEIKLKEKFI